MTQTAIVTGAAQGLGAAIAADLAAEGYNVALADIDLDGACALASELDPTGVRVLALALDVRDPAAFEAAAAAVEARWGAFQVLVNNAVVTVAKPVLEITADEFDAVLAVNLRGVFIGSQIAGRRFKAAGYGRIVNLASLAGQNGGAATGAHYAASKGAIITLTKVFARDLAAHGVTVNAVAPGPLDLPSVRRTVPADKLAAIVETIPVGRLGAPAFVARMVSLLASPEAASVTGATWDVNGGLYMR
ncbi:SDR family NAD(P)-dependent oxidoreductase [Caulobacter sp. 602-1]|uniref:SDR family NAD(P)-dependent oxidoreductase n=1 Tax=Caulobacter sp. 602-1 TaxID=2492472 RepID=UPI000F63A1B6|nr:SDR family NAD(P)-dependent oxidoreductase [Caulobacter sp. 602-1]RRN63811.1 SDR family oxidoreductase [Caulobacter sp. 602-1]